MAVSIIKDHNQFNTRSNRADDTSARWLEPLRGLVSEMDEQVTVDHQMVYARSDG